MLCWYADTAGLMVALERHRAAMDAGDAHVESLATLDGFCSVCQRPSQFTVNTGVMMGAHPHLRDGIMCPRCGLVNRNRLVFDAVMETPWPRDKGALILEATSALFAQLSRRLPGLHGSEYFGPGHAAGDVIDFNGASVVHRSITDIGFGDGELGLVVHNDVLEHVADTAAAFAECRRVLCDGGACVFTMPFFPYRTDTLVRGKLRADGSIEHIEPPEYHGDILRLDGIYTFYHFGPDVVQVALAAGFRRVELGMDYDVYRGYTTNNYRYGDEALMPPIVLRAWS